MGLIKQIIKLALTIIKIIIVLAAIAYPIFILNTNPITFYWDKLNIVWEFITSSDFSDKLKELWQTLTGLL